MKKLARYLLVSLLIIFTTLSSACQIAKKEKPDYNRQSVSYNIDEINEFLLETGMPLDTLKALDEHLKIYIYETIDAKEKLTFNGHTVKVITAQDTDSGYVDVNSNTTPHLFLTVTAFKDGNGIYHIYPAFEWESKAKIANDTFAFALPDGWYLVPSKYNLRIWYKEDLNGNWEMIEDLSRPSIATLYGYGWQIPGYKGKTTKYYAKKAYVKGHAYFCVKSTTSTSDKKICISYTDDTTSAATAAYSLAFGPLSVKYTPVSGISRFTSSILKF